MIALTSSGVPSWNLTPWRSLNVQVSLSSSTFQVSARPGPGVGRDRVRVVEVEVQDAAFVDLGPHEPPAP